MTLIVGDVAPNFTLLDQNGEKIDLNQLRGKKIVLYFYPKDDTSGCTMQAKNFSCLVDEFSKSNSIIMGMSPDGVQSHAKFTSKYNLNVTLIADESKETLNKYGVFVEKSMYGKKYMGVERSTFLIDENGIITHIWRKVKVPNHAETVLAAAQSL
jgi:thioredoxin-dependent peroxiredoxin